ncbi:HNH endonuclease family protein [Streptomyces sp. ST2-7A]|uniref:HNH endonuclease family protein n=1 Tax=Streptomyces sp. ST2-7A TaxID=2907214 RepID=UPI001F28CC1D|nr:HNH endonuclease family protein [Streptomyces sp. ST2-7A]MCE7079021.1 HNH endonuclease family protein [Streptomyces sp. ST2-7A]
MNDVRRRGTAGRAGHPGGRRGGTGRRGALLAGALVTALCAALTGCSDEFGEALDDALNEALPEETGSGGSGGSGGSEEGSVSDRLPGMPTVEEGRRQLSELTVAEEGSMAGYSREAFPHWITVQGCTTRQTVLERDGVDVVTDDRCQPTSGEWFSPFDNVTLTEAGDVDIDHMVPLANAWRSGADSWNEEQRREFANDLENPQLIAVSASSNRSKGDQAPGDWEPVEEYWCEYGLAWTATKHVWDLTITEDEHAMLTEMLDTCGG